MLPRAGFAGLVVMLACATEASAQPAARPADPPESRPLDLRLLPVWTGHVEGGAVQVHAADVDGEVLRGVLAARGAVYVAPPTDKRVTGRVAVKKRAQALAALIALEPSLAITSRPMRGGGPNVDLDFRAAPTHDLYRLFADVMRTNVVVLVPPAKLTVRVKRKPAGRVLAEVARATGAAIDKPAANLLVVRPDGGPPTRRLPGGGAKLNLDARQIRAGHLVELIRQLDGPATTNDAACSGAAVDLRLTKLPSQTAVAVVALAGGIPVSALRCALPLLTLPLSPNLDLRLLATVERGGKRLAAVENAKQVYYLEHGAGGWEIGAGWIQHRGRVGDRIWQVHPRLAHDDDAIATPLGPAASQPLSIPLRLAATIIDGRERFAIVELEDTFHVLSDGKVHRVGHQWIEVKVLPGKAYLVSDGFHLLLSR